MASRLAIAHLKKALVGAAAAAVLLVSGVSTADAQVDQRDNGEADYHVVNDGDTMWDLSGRYYGDTYEWPRMWSHNSHITNPHWIYPGDIVYLREESSAGGASPAQANNGDRGGKSSRTSDDPDQGMFLPLGGYITTDEAQYVGRMIASRKEASMLAEHDTAWVGWGEDSYSDKEKEEINEEERIALRDPGEIAKGDRFAVVREISALKDEEGEVIAHKYRVLGEVVVTKTDDKNYDEVKIVQSWHEMYRGDALIPYERQLKVVKQSKASNDKVASIVDTLNPGSMFGEHSYVFLDKGAEDDVRTGNRFFVYQRNEGLHKGVDGELDPKVPWTRVGQVLVLDVRENYSTAVVIDSKRELIVGDRLEMYDGY